VVRVYTDGACLGNPGPGGWAWVAQGGRYAAGAEEHTTNQRMEITAAWRAVEAHPDASLVVVSDSTYVVNCFRQRWWQGWIAKGWVNSKKQPVANRDLWEPFIELVTSRTDVDFEWVKGHSGDPLNDAADRLATDAAASQRGREGDRLDPVELAAMPEDEPAERSGDGLDGRAVVVAGHRPPELGGYDDNPVADAVRHHLREILEAKRQLHPDLVVVTGLGLGAEQLGAEAAVEAGVPFVAVLPFPAPESVWPEASQLRYRRLVPKAREIRMSGRKAPESRQQAGKALGRRDTLLARLGDEAIVVWDGADAAVGRQVKTLQRSLGEEEVWVIDPAELTPARPRG
jgi:ribonuclease HI/uncharacterized phage-like protein YoqJ